jgi:hypothetical protein
LITAIARPLDMAWPTNRAVAWLLPVLAALGGFMAWRDGLGGSDIAFAAFRTALLGFGAWAVARELAPDDQPAAFFAMAIALTTLLNVPSPGFALLFLALFLARVVNRSTGLDLKSFDVAAVLLLGAYTSWSHASPVPLAVTAVAFAWSGALPNGVRGLLWPAAGIAAAGAVLGGVFLGPGIGSGAPLSRHGLVVPAVFAAGFLVAILATRRVAAVGDHDGVALLPGRVRAGMWVVLLLVAGNLAHGSPLAAKGVALWSVLGGVALGLGVSGVRRLFSRAR